MRWFDDSDSDSDSVSGSDSANTDLCPMGARQEKARLRLLIAVVAMEGIAEKTKKQKTAFWFCCCCFVFWESC
ncbi:hypothetical protein Sjap_023057 [Stephania japonica]|uniref:Uncharacterized protein n=1 Tax=Stephania japonica TaxID=461633 RepID=A0AAP0HVG8_9MAGN